VKANTVDCPPSGLLTRIEYEPAVESWLVVSVNSDDDVYEMKNPDKVTVELSGLVSVTDRPLWNPVPLMLIAWNPDAVGLAGEIDVTVGFGPGTVTAKLNEFDCFRLGFVTLTEYVPAKVPKFLETTNEVVLKF